MEDKPVNMKRSDKKKIKKKKTVQPSNKKPKKKHNKLVTFLLILVFMVGLGLIFNQQIMYFLVGRMTKDNKPGVGLEPVFDTEQVQPASITDVAEAMANKDKFRASGQIAIPDLNIHLDVYEGLNSQQLFLGAGEHVPRSEASMGQDGNYILASHRLPEGNGTLLFTPLQNSQEGQLIYLTDGKKVYIYKTLWTKTVNASEDVSDINVETKVGEKLITLYTCNDDRAGTQYRIVVRGEMIDSFDILDENDERLSVFTNGSNELSGYLKYYYLGYY